jgi:diacylglycerol kinase family enzyme
MRFPGVTAQIKVDNQAISGTFVLAVIANSRLYGGGLVHLSEDARLDDGRLDIWLFKGKMFRETVGHVVRLLTARHMMSESTIHLRGRRVLVQTQEATPVQLDGEPAGQAPLYVAIEPQSLRLLAPDGAPTDLFGLPGVPFITIERSL